MEGDCHYLEGNLNARRRVEYVQSLLEEIGLDGRRIRIAANIASAEEAAPAIAAGAEGIGLFRTEMLFLDRDQAPSEDDQFEHYRRAVVEAGGRPVIIRTLDVGGVKLQAGDAENLGIWREMQRLSQVQFDTIYARLGVKFDHALGESFYNPRLQGVVDDLMARGLARESEGAKAIFSDRIRMPPGFNPA